MGRPKGSKNRKSMTVADIEARIAQLMERRDALRAELAELNEAMAASAARAQELTTKLEKLSVAG